MLQRLSRRHCAHGQVWSCAHAHPAHAVPEASPAAGTVTPIDSPIYIYIYIYIYMYRDMNKYTYTYIYLYMYTYIHIIYNLL